MHHLSRPLLALRAAGCVLLLMAGCGPARPSGITQQTSLTLAVAASARDVAVAIAKDFENEHNTRVEVMPGSSSVLAKQITEGAPVDVFLCADQALANHLRERRFLDKSKNLLGNRLVVIAPAATRLRLRALPELPSPEVKRLALALESVPAGKYARQALQRSGVWDHVKLRVIGGDDVRATLAYVEQGADAGIVYATDAAGSSKVQTCFTIDQNLHDPIVYPLVLTARGVKNPDAARLYDYLASPAAAEHFRRAGFTVLE